MMHFSRDPQTGRLLPYSEHTTMATGVTDDFRTLPPALRKAVLARMRAFAANPYMGRLQGKQRGRRVDDRELLIAYKAARWKIQLEAKTGARKLPGESVTAQAHVLVGKRYGLEPETVESFLQDARRGVPPATRRVIEGLRGETAWELTLDAPGPSDSGGLKT
jgi:hypothetical protein